MKQSNFLSLGWRDFLRGLLMSVLTPIVVIIQQSINAGVLVLEWKSILTAGIAGGLAYLAKNLFTAADKPKGIVGDRPVDSGGR